MSSFCSRICLVLAESLQERWYLRVATERRVVLQVSIFSTKIHLHERAHTHIHARTQARRHICTKCLLTHPVFSGASAMVIYLCIFSLFSPKYRSHAARHGTIELRACVRSSTRGPRAVPADAGEQAEDNDPQDAQISRARS